MESDSQNNKKNVSINDDKSNETDSTNEIKHTPVKSSNLPPFPKNIIRYSIVSSK